MMQELQLVNKQSTYLGILYVYIHAQIQLPMHVYTAMHRHYKVILRCNLYSTNCTLNVVTHDAGESIEKQAEELEAHFANLQVENGK